MPSENFGDMAELCEYIHSLGLKVGIYSTPWVTSYASFIGGSSDNAEGKWNDPEGKLKRVHGKYKFDVNDAKQWGQWGIDYLKYDWRPNDVETVKRMSQALRGSGRDIVYSLSNSAPIENALELVKWANCWRTTGDIRDQWDNGRLSRKGGHCGIIDIWRFHSQWRPFNRPGHYNDADMMVIGNVGGPWSKEIRPCGLSFDEQYTHISSWVLFAGPMLIGCPLEQMDEFTLGLLSNAEVLEINQDTLCLQAETSKFNDSIWFKKLSDGSTAAGIFNRSDAEREMTCVFKYIKVNGRQKVRDLWKQEDIGEFDTSFSVKVNSHGVRLVRITGVK
jgi:alpha-galactosidase